MNGQSVNEVLECAKFIRFFLETLMMSGGVLSKKDVDFAKQKAHKQGYSDSVIEEAVKQIIPKEFL